MGKYIEWLIIGLVVVAALTHPAGAAGGMTAFFNGLKGESTILAGQNQTGGQKGNITGVGNFY